MAPSSLHNAGWGVFYHGSHSLVQGQPITPNTHGDLVIHWPEVEQAVWSIQHIINDNQLNQHIVNHQQSIEVSLKTLRRLLRDYAWDASVTGGFYEGPPNSRIAALSPGLALLANSHLAKVNALPFVPTVDEGGQTRLSSPGAGAFTHYHNWTFFAKRDIDPGDEIFVPYGDHWFQERQELQQHQQHSSDTVDSHHRHQQQQQQQQQQQYNHPVDSHSHYCLDHVRPMARSNIPTAGRGLQAARFLKKGDTVLPVPVFPLWRGRDMMRIQRQRQDGTTEEHWQLLRNYCLVHPQSSLWLFPYGPGVSLINHADTTLGLSANVKLQWAANQPFASLDMSLDELLEQLARDDDKTTFLLELVALRPIYPGEELLLDYGSAWQAAWQRHVQNWSPPPGADSYAPAYVHDDAIAALRTAEELRDHPYPDNIFTSCFYAYNNSMVVTTAPTTASRTGEDVVTVPWQETRGLYQLHNLRPCLVLKRENAQLPHQRKKQGTRFVVQIRNRPNLAPEAIVPTGQVHIVHSVPRHAIRFSDKVYTTDVHLSSAFRHEIHLNVEHDDDDVDGWPAAWKDLKEAEK